MSRIISAGFGLTNTFGSCRRKRLARQRRLDLLPVLVGGQLREARRQRAGGVQARSTRSPSANSSLPQVVGLGRFVLEQVPVGVDRILQVVAGDRGPDRLAVDVDQDRGRLAEEDHRRIGLYALDVLGDDLARVDAGEDPVERDDALALGMPTW